MTTPSVRRNDDGHNPYTAPAAFIDVAKPSLVHPSESASVCLYLGVLSILIAGLLPPVAIGYILAGLSSGRHGWNAPNRIEARIGVVLCLGASLLSVVMYAGWVILIRSNT